MEYRIPWPGRSVDYTQEDRTAVLRAMDSNPQTQGKYLREFEEAFANYHGRPSFAVSSGAAALEIAAMLVNIKPGDEVIIPAHTYTATAIPFARRGAVIKWADIHPDFRTVTAETIAPLVSKRTRAVVVVHLYGMSAPMGCILELARQHDLMVIEDCAQSLGATYEYEHNWGLEHAGTPKGRSGTHGDIACYSFHGQKNITTLGEGGMITVKDPALAKLIPGLRHNGHRQTGDTKVTDFDLLDIYPYNFSIGEAQCAVGVTQMGRLDVMNADRYNKARMVIDGLADIEDLEFQKIPRGATHTYHLLNARYPERDELVDILGRIYGIQCVVQYKPLYRYPLFKHHTEANCPNTEDFYKHSLSFPFAEWFPLKTVRHLRDSIRDAINLMKGKPYETPNPLRVVR